MPTVSIIIPTYNSAEFLTEALDSVFAQTYRDFEVIVVNDGSTDHTAERIRPFLDRITYIEQANAGPSVARNRGIFAASGKYIAFLDADDLWAPEKLERQVEYLESHPDVLMTYTDTSRNSQPGVVKDSALKKYPHACSGDVFLATLRGPFMATSSLVIRADALARAGLFDPTIRGAEDTDLWLRISNFGPVELIDDILTYIRRGHYSITRTLQFQRDRVRATEILFARWSHCDGVTPILQECVPRFIASLAYAEKQNGNFKAAARAYWRCALLKHFPAQSLLRAIFYSMPPALIQLLTRIMSSTQVVRFRHSVRESKNGEYVRHFRNR